MAAGRGYSLVDVVAGNGPPCQPAVAYAVDPEGTGSGWLRLFGVGRDDLQIRLRAEREQRVVGAQPDVPAPGLGPDAEAFRYVRDRGLEVGNGVDQVVNQHVILNITPAASSASPLDAGAIRGCHRQRL
jgi:hypothetical protein